MAGHVARDTILQLVTERTMGKEGMGTWKPLSDRLAPEAEEKTTDAIVGEVDSEVDCAFDEEEGKTEELK